MVKLATTLELALPPNRTHLPSYRWLYESLRSEILEGRLRPGTRLPSTRDLSRQCVLARGTVVNAFEQLRSEGYVRGTIGSGTYVSDVLPEDLLQIAPGKPARREEGSKAARRQRSTVSEYARRARLFPGYDDRRTRAFRANLPALGEFPVDSWTTISLRCLRRLSKRHLLGCKPLGHLPLRRAIADYLGQSRGVRCSPEQIVIVSGVQEAIDLTARVLVNPGDRVCTEDPGYPGAAFAFRAYGAKVTAAGIDDEGIAVGQLPRGHVRLIYVTPGHQFPLGTTMSLARRLQLLAWAQKAGAMILEDDYDSEFRYSGRPIPALQGLDRQGLVLYAGSFSKVLFPALRLGYVVVPPRLMEAFETVQSLTMRHAPVIEQLILTEFMEEGLFSRHLRRMREIYAERLSVLLEEGRSQLGGLLEISSVEAGLQTVGWLRCGMSAKAAVAAAAKREIDLAPLDWFSQSKRLPTGLQLGFAALDPKEIRHGVRELAIALEDEQKARAHASPRTRH